MKKIWGICLGIVFVLGMASSVSATPSTQIWIPSTDVQPYGTFHFGIDHYTTVFRTAEDGAHDFPTDYGLTVGVLPFEKLQLELGVDLFEPTDDPLSFNAKLGVPEEAFGKYFPAVAVGGFGFGAETDSKTDPHTDFNIVYGEVAKKFPIIGRLSAGYYIGNDELLLDADGQIHDRGVLLSWDRTMPEISENLWLAVDYQSGDNGFGAMSAGGCWAFSKNVSLIVGYVFFNDDDLMGKDTITTQLDINFGDGFLFHHDHD